MLYIKMILRSWQRACMSSLISIVSLVVGLTCSTLLLLFILSEYKIASALGDTDSVFQIEGDDPFNAEKSVRSHNISPDLVYKLADHFAQIEFAAPVVEARCIIEDALEGGGRVIAYIVTPQFADMFDIGVVEGDLASTLSAKDEIAVTDKFMQLTYGRPAKIGDRLRMRQGGGVYVNGVMLQPMVRDLTVTAILADPDKTPFDYQILMSVGGREQIVNTNYIGGADCFAFVKLKDNSSVEELEAMIDADFAKTEGGRRLYLRPFDNVYVKATVSSKDSRGFIRHRDSSLLFIGFTVSLLILVMSIFNYINITMTRARGRLRNLAAQRIFGASKLAVHGQTVLDTSLMILLSFVLSLFVIKALLPDFNSFMGSRVSLGDLLTGWNLVVVFGLLVVVIVFSVAYILLKLDTTNALDTLKNPMGRNVNISSVMVVAQFVISIALVSVSLNVTRQMDYISRPLPSFKSVIRITPTDNNLGPREFVSNLASLPWIEGCTPDDVSPNSTMSMEGQTIRYISSSNDIFRFYDLNLIEGRMLEAGDSSNCVIVNETLLSEFSFTAPIIGREFEFMRSKYRIVGVVEDFMYEDAHKKIQALIIRNNNNNVPLSNFWHLYVKVSGDPEKRMDDIQAFWTAQYPDRSGLETKLMPQVIRERHKDDERMRTMVDVMMVVSMILTAIGLFGLAFYTVARRTREIAIRKVHGSTSMQVVLLLCRTFALWVGVAVVIALPLAYFVSDWWLSGFVYHVNIEWWVFALTIVLVSIVAFVTVIFQTLSAARANPANSIKAE